MTDDERELSAFFDAARRARPEPSADLMSRILADAAAEAPIEHEAIAAQPKRSGGRWRLRDLMRIGWQAGASAAACMVAGMWIGYAGPDFVPALSDATLGTAYTFDGSEALTFDTLGTMLLESET
ncbi:MAG: hypothetical protein AAFU59_04630 [Pseudomonadota bacterium]